MRIAIIGAGLCGLACSVRLSLQNFEVTLFDQTGIGAGCSSVPVGLLHTYAGPKAQKSFLADEGYRASRELLELAQSESITPLFRQDGILRPVVAGLDIDAFQETAKNYSDTEWWDEKRTVSYIPELLAYPGLFIRSGYTVNCPAYLNALWRLAQKHGATFMQQKITHPHDLSGFDKIVFTVGYGVNEVRGIELPPIDIIKGQLLELNSPTEVLLPFALNATVQFSQMTKESVFAGATYERKWSHLDPDPACVELIRSKIALMSPAFSELNLKSIWAGLRAATKDKKPFIKNDKNIWIIGGMGSKGLLYHALMAKRLLKEI